MVKYEYVKASTKGYFHTHVYLLMSKCVYVGERKRVRERERSTGVGGKNGTSSHAYYTLKDNRCGRQMKRRRVGNLNYKPHRQGN